MSWNKPVEKKCPRCGGTLVEKGTHLVCMDTACGYMEDKKEATEE
jgi:DNA topoisomerase-1